METKSAILSTTHRTSFHGLSIVHIANSHVSFTLELRTVLFPSVQRLSKQCLPQEIPTLKSRDVSSTIPLSEEFELIVKSAYKLCNLCLFVHIYIYIYNQKYSAIIYIYIVAQHFLYTCLLGLLTSATGGLSVYVQEPLVIGRRGCTGERFTRRNVWELITDASNPGRIQSRTSVV